MVQIVTNSNWWGGGNKNAVIWPSSAVDWDIVIFDWDTWKIIKDSWEKLSNFQGKWIEVNVATAYGTAAKVWTTTAGDYTPTKWDFLLVNFVNGCSVDNPTLNIDWSGAKAIRTGSANANKSTFALWSTANSNIKALFYYDWTYYRCWSTTNANTTYSAMSVAEWKTATATNSRAMRSDYLKQIIKYHAVSDTEYSGAWDWKTDIAPSQNAVYDKIEAVVGSIPTDNAQLANGSWYITSWDLPDFTTYQLKSNMVTSLNSADDTHYPTAKAVKDAITSSWGWDVSWPSSSVDWHLAVFDWATGKLIKDWWAVPTPTTVVDNLNSTSATSALSANQGRVLNNSISTINWKIPSAASTSNQLADKNYVDNSINSVAAYYITKNAAGDQFATKAELDAATTFYSGWAVRTPTRNDYTIVLDDETHNDEVTRYIYNNGWEYQYTINESPLTQAQLDALNSWVTSWKVTSYDSVVSTIATYWNIVTHNTSEFATSAQGAKADSALQPNDNISELNNDAWYITWVNWGDIGWTLSNQVDLSNALWAKANDNAVVKLTWAQTIAWTKTFSTSPVVPSKTTAATNTWTAIATEAQVYTVANTLSWIVNDTAFWASWDWDTTHAPSKNAIYGVLWDVETLLANL